MHYVETYRHIGYKQIEIYGDNVIQAIAEGD